MEKFSPSRIRTISGNPQKLSVRLLYCKEQARAVPCACAHHDEISPVVTTSFESAPIAPALGEETIWTNAAEILATRCILFNQAVAVRQRSPRKKWAASTKVCGLWKTMTWLLKLSIEGPWTSFGNPSWCVRGHGEQSLSKDLRGADQS